MRSTCMGFGPPPRAASTQDSRTKVAGLRRKPLPGTSPRSTFNREQLLTKAIAVVQQLDLPGSGARRDCAEMLAWRDHSIAQVAALHTGRDFGRRHAAVAQPAAEKRRCPAICMPCSLKNYKRNRRAAGGTVPPGHPSAFELIRTLRSAGPGLVIKTRFERRLIEARCRVVQGKAMSGWWLSTTGRLAPVAHQSRLQTKAAETANEGRGGDFPATT